MWSRTEKPIGAVSVCVGGGLLPFLVLDGRADGGVALRIKANHPSFVCFISQ